MAFKYAGSLHGGARVMRKGIISNSAVITVGDAVGRDADGFIQLVGAGALVEGIVVAITRSDVDDAAPANNGAGGAFTDTYTAAADNETVAKVSVLVDVAKSSKYAVTLDATAGTTTGSDLNGGYFFDVVAASDTLDESTASTTSAQFALLGQDAEVTDGVFVNIYESLLM